VFWPDNRAHQKFSYKEASWPNPARILQVEIIGHYEHEGRVLPSITDQGMS